MNGELLCLGDEDDLEAVARDRYGRNGPVSWISNYDPLSWTIPPHNQNALLLADVALEEDYAP